MSKRMSLMQLSHALTVALLTAIALPVAAQATPYRVTCQATVQNQGVNLTYRVAGSLPETTTAETPQTLIGTSLTLTVQWRDRNGRVQTLLVTTQAAAEEEEGSLRTAQPVHPKD
jgi:multisubunit Na+/H+ antiporter MnhC subunit